MKKILTISIITLLISAHIYAQTEIERQAKLFVGYDLGEMAFNKFQNFAGEIGYKFKTGQTLSFTYLNIKLTEQHLSSGFGGAVDGDHVSGHWVGYEALYNTPLYVFKNADSFIYGGVSGGHHSNRYTHTIINDSVQHDSFTLGIDLGFRESNVFKIKGLYYNLQIPIRYYFKPLEEATLGDSIVKRQVFEQTISFFVGYEF